MTIDKARIREQMRARRKAVSAAERAAASQAVCARLLARDDVHAALAGKAPIAVYLASPDELDLTPFVTAALAHGAALVAPRWNGAAYELAPLTSLSSLVAGPHGILEPPPASTIPYSSFLLSPSLWLVPGLAFTRTGKRLGYGGGWYDRLLAGTDPASVKLGVAYAFQILPDLPSEPHDILMDALVWSDAEGRT